MSKQPMNHEEAAAHLSGLSLGEVIKIGTAIVTAMLKLATGGQVDIPIRGIRIAGRIFDFELTGHERPPKP